MRRLTGQLSREATYRRLSSKARPTVPASIALGKRDAGRPHTVLIDGSPLIFRAHYGISQPLTRKDGTVVTAVFGFSRLLLNMIASIDAEYVGLFLDHKDPTFRSDIDPQYKANRDALPVDLVPQIPLISRAAKACGVYPLKMAGYEADDLIATYARIAGEELGHQVTVVSPDKDLMQLVTPDVMWYDPSKRFLLDEAAVATRWGVPPQLVPHIQALAGDKVDNIPGAKGIGPKIAANLINQFGSLDALMGASHDSLSKPIAKSLATHAEDISRSYQLAKLHDHVEVPPFEVLQKRELDRNGLYGFLVENQFFSLVARFLGPAFVAEPKPEDKQGAKDVVENLRGTTVVQTAAQAKRVIAQLRTLRGPKYFHACDTEVVNIDLKTESPVGHGKVICASIYVGPEHDFGNGPRIWIDNLDDAEGIIDLFKEYFEDKGILKVWHNYSFDRAVLHNHGIDCQGFGGDTMHMARLWNASMRSYSLANLTQEFLPHLTVKERFGRPLLKQDGTPAKNDIFIPSLEAVQRDPESVEDWIDYSTLDAEATWQLRAFLQEQLQETPWHAHKSQYDFYRDNWRPFGELLTTMERTGMYVDVEHLQKMEKLAKVDAEKGDQKFLEWASSYCPDAKYMNAGSTAQKQQLFFAPATNRKTGERMDAERQFKTLNVDGYIEEGKTKPLKNRTFTIKGFGMPPVGTNASGWPSVGQEQLIKLAGVDIDSGVFGAAYEFFGGEERGLAACEAIDSLLDSGRTETLLSNFIIPLQHMLDKEGRIHTSMNLNTETGRLSCRKPNLQNQPSMAKDRYRVRQAFVAPKGKKLIVSDYGQLELRLLAHASNCESMIDAFAQGGDFHSRTAIGMYEHVAEAVREKKVLLEWNDDDGPRPDLPMLKDAFRTERTRAKTLNFSIAYGKTARGLSKDWGISLEAAEKTLELWYQDRPEVREWQRNVIEQTREAGCTFTLMGRRRPLPMIRDPKLGLRKGAERAAINTPLQGGAADIVMKAMLLLGNHRRFSELGWRLVLQIHDELICEGPEESAAEALQIVVDTMENPLTTPLRVKLPVDASIGDNWFEAK